MNRIVLEKADPNSQSVISMTDTIPYDYRYNSADYACINVSTEVLCILKIIHGNKIRQRRYTLYGCADISTYVLYRHEYEYEYE
jgi:hypothetical protein